MDFSYSEVFSFWSRDVRVWIRDLSLDNVIKLLGLTVSVAAAITAYRTYIKNLKWNRRKFASETVRQIFEKPTLKFTFDVLDFPSRPHWIKDGDVSRKYYYSREQILEVLRPDLLNYHVMGAHDRNEILYARECFDDFIRNIEWLFSFKQAGLMEWSDFAPYFGYWCEMLSGQRHVDREILANFWAYCEKFHNEPVVRVFVDKVTIEHQHVRKRLRALSTLKREQSR